jgi:transposase InsO family protein
MDRESRAESGDRQVLPGTRWLIDGRPVKVAKIVAVNQVVVEDEEGTQRDVCPGELRTFDAADARSGGLQAAANISDEDWERARSLQADIQAEVGSAEVTQTAVESLARKWQVSRATVWRRIQRYRGEQCLLALVDRPPGPLPGSAQIAPELENIIVEVARRWWRHTESATIAEIAPDVYLECKARGLNSPSRATIARRLRALRKDPGNFHGETRSALRERTRLMRASYNVADPLAVVQIDHTVADVFLIDPLSRQPIGRPTLTVAIDVATRCVLGICLSLEAPSSLLVALCLEHAVFPKDDWLGAIGTSVEWPMYGRMSALHSDNGREFHSSGFRRGCDLNRIEVIYRPPATPRFGGHVERLIGTLGRRHATGRRPAVGGGAALCTARHSMSVRAGFPHLPAPAEEVAVAAVDQKPTHHRAKLRAPGANLMNYAIIGTGNVGSALARQFARAGLAVSIANTRGPDTIQPLVKELGDKVTAKTLDDALAGGATTPAAPRARPPADGRSCAKNQSAVPRQA